jgi:hypothetical protein
MEENKEVKEEVVESEETVPEASGGEVEGKVADRPEINYQRELERKNAALERARQELEVEKAKGGKRDQNDMSTWPDHELRMVAKTNDPQYANMREQAEELLLERKIRSIRERERGQEKRVMADLELKTKFPESLDPSSELSVKMEQVMYDYDLQKSPAGRLAAAKIASAELGNVSSKSTAKERKAEADRVARVKKQMVDGDRSKSTEIDTDVKKVEEIERKIKTEGITQADGVSDALKLKGMDRKSFFGR